MPSIVSRDRLLILDPHIGWSEKLGHTKAGGPFYDFVTSSDDAATKDHMAAFQTAMSNREQYFDGTIIRIPLRTQAQAVKSEIVNRATTASEMLEILQTFASEYSEHGLLFMKHIERLEVRAAGMSTVIEIKDRETTRV